MNTYDNMREVKSHIDLSLDVIRCGNHDGRASSALEFKQLVLEFFQNWCKGQGINPSTGKPLELSKKGDSKEGETQSK